MIQEDALIPYHTSPIPKGPWLVFAPHPDDETFGMGGSLLLAAFKGIEVVLVVLTDGSLGGTTADEDKFVRLREQEAREAARRLRVKVVHFWRQKDRQLQATPELVDRVAELVQAEKPASVFFPSPLELHPDHRAAAFIVWQGLQHCPDFNGKAYSYEISVQCQANLLIDITSVAEEKSAVLEVYRSQLKENDYKAVVQALNKARTYTLPPEVKFAEAFFAYGDVASSDLAALTLSSLSPYWQKAIGSTMPLVSVITRTKDRPQMLRKALKSVAEQTYPNIEMLVINDGGLDVADVVHDFKGVISRIRHISLSPAKGRSAAANTGLQEATGQYLMFLDDDDWLYHNHIAKLVDVLEREESSSVAYTGVECMSEESPGTWKKINTFNEPYDPVRLLIQNYIPSHAALFRRHFVDAGCRFDEDLGIYEDWDFWLQLSQKTTFRYVEGISAVYRITGTGGFGVSGDHALIQHSRIIFYEKWRRLWSAEQLLGIIEYAKCERDVEFLKREREAMERQTLSLEADLAESRCHLQKIVQELEATRRAVAEAEKDSAALEQLVEQIHAKDSALEEQARQIHAKDVHICNIESELNLMEQSKAWRMAEFFRHLFYIKLLGKFSLLQKGMLTISREGFPVFFARTKRYLRKNKDVATMGLIESDYDKWIKKNQLTDEMIGEIKKEIAGFQYRPKISIIMPVYNVDQIWLEKAINSVINQLYENWELCIADNASTKKHIKEILKRYSKKENGIRVMYLEENQGIAGASNEALSLAAGDYIGLLDNDDELTIDALYENVKFLNKSPEADLIYSDEDKADTCGNRTEPFFKPDYSPDFLLTKNYICHFSLFRRSIINNIGGFKKGYEGSQDYDLILRFIEKTKPERIFHIPKILYHWRKIPGSAVTRVDAKSYAFASAKKALSDYLRRNNIQGEVVDGNCSSYRVRRKVKNNYKVSIIIPFKDQSEVLRRCVSSIIEKTTYRKYEIVLINNQSEQEETFEYLDKIKDNPIFRILAYDKPFNFSAINNYAVSQVDSEYIVLLNNDTEVISPDWIENMLEFVQRKDVGAVGALLYYPNDTIQHAGVILGIKGVAGHSHKHMKRDSEGYFGRIKIVHNLSAVTAACLMTKKSIFKEIDGFDVNLTHAFNDVDYCLKIRERGYLIVYTPYAELYHHESLSRGYEDTPEKQARFRKEIKLFQGKWKEILANGDPYYNPNLTLDREDFSIKV